MRISDWSSDMCSSDLFAERGAVAFARELSGDARGHLGDPPEPAHRVVARRDVRPAQMEDVELAFTPGALGLDVHALQQVRIALGVEDDHHLVLAADLRSEEHTSELQSLMRISYAVFCLKKKKTIRQLYHTRSYHKKLSST